jgi:hypothetical protein
MMHSAPVRLARFACAWPGRQCRGHPPQSRHHAERPPEPALRLPLQRAGCSGGGGDVISAAASQVAVRVIRRDEEQMIAKTVCRVVGLPCEKEMCHEDEEG